MIGKIVLIMSTKPAKRREYLHLQLPVSTKDLLRRLRYDTRLSITEILIRVLERADKEAVIEGWLKDGGPMPAPPAREEASAA